MSPHNYQQKFNGTYKSPNVLDQNDLTEKFDILLSIIGNSLYTISGLRLFYTRRIFTRGVKKDKPFPKDFLNIPLDKPIIRPHRGMMIHPAYQSKGGNQSPYQGGIEV